jgi:amidase
VASSARALAQFFERYDVVISPVTSTPPPPLGVFDPAGDFEALWTAFWDYTNYTPLQNIAGTPALTLPLARSGDLPIGTMFAAAAGNDRTLLALAAAIEQAAPWGADWPLLRDL